MTGPTVGVMTALRCCCCDLGKRCMGKTCRRHPPAGGCLSNSPLSGSVLSAHGGTRFYGCLIKLQSVKHPAGRTTWSTLKWERPAGVTKVMGYEMSTPILKT